MRRYKRPERAINHVFVVLGLNNDIESERILFGAQILYRNLPEDIKEAERGSVAGFRRRVHRK